MSFDENTIARLARRANLDHGKGVKMHTILCYVNGSPLAGIKVNPNSYSDYRDTMDLAYDLCNATQDRVSVVDWDTFDKDGFPTRIMVVDFVP